MRQAPPSDFRLTATKGVGRFIISALNCGSVEGHATEYRDREKRQVPEMLAKSRPTAERHSTLQ